MDYNKILILLKAIVDFMEGRLHTLGKVSDELQKGILEAVIAGIYRFDVKDGKFVADQDYRRNILSIESNIEEIVRSEKYIKAISQFLDAFETVQTMNVETHALVNEIKVPNNILTPATQIIKENARISLTKNIETYLIQPLKMQLLSDVVTASEQQSVVKKFYKWNDEGITDLPTLDRYVESVAQPSIAGVHRNINNIIKDKYDLKSFIYVGGLVKDSRPFCRHLVELNRKIRLVEVPPLVIQYPDGLYPDTTKKNFMQVVGGYRCRHQALAVRTD